MNIKSFRGKIKVIAICILALLIAAAVIGVTSNTASKNTNSPKTLVSYTINKESSTAFDALLDYAKTNDTEVKYNNNYEFGVFVESIGGIKNGDDGKYWQYYINDTLGDVAADKKVLKSGDVVEWRFEKVPEF